MCGFLGEFIIVVILWIFFMKYAPEKLEAGDKVSYLTLSLPALCDFTENMCLIFGITQIFPSLVSMSRALVLPITALLSKILIKKYFSWQMLLAIAVLLSGMTLATFVQYEGEMDDAKFKLTTWGIALLCISAFIQALEVIIENRIFIIYPNLSALYLQGAVATWKMIFTILLVPFCGLITVPEQYVTGGKFEDFEVAIKLLF